MADAGAIDIKALWDRRSRALKRFDQWQRAFPRDPITPAAALAAAAALIEMLPASSRRRPVDTDGVAELHRRLRVLRGTR